MMAKNSNTKKSNTMARVALGATAVLALAGHANAALGTGICAGAGKYNIIPNVDATATTDACECAPGYVITGTTVLGATGSTCDECAAGYYLSVANTGSPENAVCTQVPVGSYLAAASTADITTTATAETIVACPTGSTSVAGATLVASCVTLPGYYVKVIWTTTSATGTYRQVPSGFYSLGGVSITTTALGSVINVDTLTDYDLGVANTAGANAAQVYECPFRGTSSTGATSVAACTPDCATTYPTSNAVALGGSCVCKSGYHGTVVDIKSGTTRPGYGGCASCIATYTRMTQASVATVLEDLSTASECRVAPGYYLSAIGVSDAGTEATQAPANSYAPGGKPLDVATYVAAGIDVVHLETPMQCPAFSTASAGSSKISDCKCVAGYSATANSCAPCAGRAAGDAIGTHVTCTAATTTTTAATPGAPGSPGAPAASGASSVSVFAAAAAIAAAQLVL